MNTPETNKLLEDLLAEIGTLGRHNCPEKLVTFCRKLEIQRDEARESLKHIEEYGTEEINAAVELRQKLAFALVERDEAREQNAKLREIAERAIEEMESGDPVGTADAYRAASATRGVRNE
jgi:hypothetical protein